MATLSVSRSEPKKNKHASQLAYEIIPFRTAYKISSGML